MMRRIILPLFLALTPVYIFAIYVWADCGGIGPGPGLSRNSVPPTDFTTDADFTGVWLFENVYTDATANGNTLTCLGSCFFVASIGEGSYALNQGGSSEPYRLTNGLSTGFPGKATTTAFSFGGKFNKSAIPDGATIFNTIAYLGDFISQQSWWVYINTAGYLVVELWDTGGTPYIATGTKQFFQGTTYNICVTYNAGTIKTYWSTGSGASTIDINDTGGPASIHGYSTADTYFLLGCYICTTSGQTEDEVYTVKRALSQTDIDSIMVHGVKGLR